jgi:hypothetical protein
MTKANKQAQAIINAIQFRIDNAENENQKSTLQTELKMLSSESGIATLNNVASNYDIDLANLAKQISVLKTESKQDYLAVYALQKVRKTLTALSTKSKSAIDGYSNAILFNLSALQTLTTKESRMVMSNAIEYSELEQVNAIKRTMNCNESTASTQASSTRMMLKALDIANVIKKNKNDVISFKDNKASQAIISFYAK